jgi:hypothetical protein
MEENGLTFPEYGSVEKLVKEYIKYDSRIQMQMRNGMSEEIYLSCSLINEFLTANQKLVERDGLERLKDESLERAAEICSKHYGKDKAHLIESFRRVTGLEFYDPERRAEIEEIWEEVLSQE